MRQTEKETDRGKERKTRLTEKDTEKDKERNTRQIEKNRHLSLIHI